MEIIIATLAVLACLLVVFEIATLTTFGLPYINQRRRQYIDERMADAWLNSLNCNIICCGGLNYIAKHFSVFGRYYFSSDKGWCVVIPWWSPMHRIIRKKYSELEVL